MKILTMEEEINDKLNEEETKKYGDLVKFKNMGLRLLIEDNRTGNGFEAATYFYGGSFRIVGEYSGGQ